MEIDMISVGDRIKKRRKELHLTQTDLYNACGITTGALSKIENGVTVPSIIIFYKLSQALCCDMEWLVSGVSSTLQNNEICKSEAALLTGFRELAKPDQEDVLDFLNYKLYHTKKNDKKLAKLSSSMPSESDDLAI